MKRMRFLVAILIVWLFFFYNIERLSEPVDIAGVAYIFLPIVAVLTLLVPDVRHIPLWALLLVPIPIFLVLKAWTGYPVWGIAMPITVTEVCVIAVTTVLAYWVSQGVAEFERAIARITIGQVEELPEPFSRGQAEMYREVRRARNHQRPLALIAIGVKEESVRVALDRMVQEVQQAMMKRYVLSDVAKTLCNELEDYNIIAQKDDHFIIVLPEVAPEQLANLAAQLNTAVSERVGVTLQTGAASFPEDAATFDGLVEKAIGEMNGRVKEETPLQSQWLETKRHTT